jgi:putative membrane protein
VERSDIYADRHARRIVRWLVSLSRLGSIEKIAQEKRIGLMGRRVAKVYGLQRGMSQRIVCSYYFAERTTGAGIRTVYMMGKITRHAKNGITGLVIGLLLPFLVTRSVSAHEGEPPAPHDLWTAWNWDFVIILSLVLNAWIYLTGYRELRHRAGLQRSTLNWRAASFICGLIVLFLTLISPLDALSAALFSAHMLQHMLLMVIIPPLLVLGISPGFFVLAFTSPVRRKLGQGLQRVGLLKPVWHALTQPIVAWGLNVLALWIWHLPRLYQIALENEALHMLEHFTFLATSLLFWWSVLRPEIRPHRGDPAILSLFTMAFQGGFLGALIIFAPTPWYSIYASTTQTWGLTPLEDQQLAGAIMWIPGGVVYTLAALILLMTRLTHIERTSNQRESSIVQK